MTLLLFYNASTDNTIGARGATSLSESLKLNTALVEIDLSGKKQRKKTHKKQPSANHSFPFSSCNQVTASEMQEQHHWVNHWNQTRHSLNSIWVVKTKENRYIKDVHQRITFYMLTLSTGNKIEDTGVTSLSESLKSNATLMKVDMSCEHTRHAKGSNQQNTLTFSFFNREQNWIYGSSIIEWSIEIKHSNHWTRSEMWRQK